MLHGFVLAWPGLTPADLEAHSWLETGGRVELGGSGRVLKWHTSLLVLNPGVS